MVKARTPWVSAMLLTRILVDVPIKVQTPPNWAAYESGISRREGAILRRRAATRTSGRNTATAAVLFMNAEIDPTISIITSSKSAGHSPARDNSRAARSSTPVSRMPAESTNIAATVRVALPLNPESPSCGEISPLSSNTESTSMPTTSTGSFSLMKSNTASAIRANVSQASGVMERTSAVTHASQTMPPGR